MTERAELGSIGKYGFRWVIVGKNEFAQVPLPPQGMTNTIEQRRAERDATAQKIVDALNAQIGESK